MDVDDESVEKKSIGAHKFLLNGISPVFRVVF